MPTEPSRTNLRYPERKRQRLCRLCDAQGRFAMLAIDQRGSLRRMIARHTACDTEDVTPEDLRLVKRVVTETVGPMATAVLTDPIYGHPATTTALPDEVGLLASVEVTGYVSHGEHERRSRLLDGWEENVVHGDVDAAKLLLYHHPGAREATRRHQDEIVETVGAACAEAGMPFVLELVTYALDGEDAKGAAFARRKADLVVDGARAYSDPRFGVDLLKLEFPANLKYAEEYQDRSFGRGEVVCDRAGVEEACRRLDEAARTPWVILSAGVEPEEFIENIRLANAAGASGFLCGRAVWKHVVDDFPDEARMRAYMQSEGRRHFRAIREANAAAKPWHAHRRFQQPAPARPE